MVGSSVAFNSPKEKNSRVGPPRSTADSDIKVSRIGLSGLNMDFDMALTASFQMCFRRTLTWLKISSVSVVDTPGKWPKCSFNVSSNDKFGSSLNQKQYKS